MVGDALEPFRPFDAVSIQEESDEETKRQLYCSLTDNRQSTEQPFSRRKQVFAEFAELAQQFCGIMSKPLPVFIQLRTHHRYVCHPTGRFRRTVGNKAADPSVR